MSFSLTSNPFADQPKKQQGPAAPADLQSAAPLTAANLAAMASASPMTAAVGSPRGTNMAPPSAAVNRLSSRDPGPGGAPPAAAGASTSIKPPPINDADMDDELADMLAAAALAEPEENPVVERYVLSEMGAVRELDEAIDRARGILEASLYTCARQSLFHIAKNREQLQREQREFGMEQLRQDFEAKRLAQKEHELVRRQEALRAREEATYKREELMASRERALDRILMFANEDLRRQRIMSQANVAVSLVTLEHIRRLELTSAATPQQLLLANVSKYVAELNANVSLDSTASPPRDMVKDFESHNNNSGADARGRRGSLVGPRSATAEELISQALHSLPPRPPPVSSFAAGGPRAGSRYGALSRSDAARQREADAAAAAATSAFFGAVEASPAFAHRMKRDFGLDVCPLHVRGNRAMHVVRESSVLVVAAATAASQTRKHFQMNVIGHPSTTAALALSNGPGTTAAVTANAMHIVPTHTTVGEAILQAELFQHAVVRSLLLLGGAQAAQVQLFGGGGGGGAGASAWSRASEAMRLQSASAFRSPVLSFRYFAQRERGIEVRRDVAVDRSGGGGGAGAGAGATTTTTATEATPRVLQISAAGGADSDNAQFGDCVVLVIGAATRDTHEATSTSSHAAASGLHAPVAPVPLAGARPMSAPVGARGGNLHRRGPHGAAAAGVRSVTVQAVLARVPLSAFRGAAAANNDESAGDSGDDDDRHAASGVFRGAFSASSPAPVPAGPSEVVSTYSVFVDLTTKCINVTCTSAQQQQQMQQRHRQMQQQQQQQQTAAMRRIIDAMTARSAGKEPAPTTVAVSFDEQLESPPVRAALIANDAAMFIGVMITSPCGAVEIVNLEDVGGEEES